MSSLERDVVLLFVGVAAGCAPACFKEGVRDSTGSRCPCRSVCAPLGLSGRRSSFGRDTSSSAASTRPLIVLASRREDDASVDADVDPTRDVLVSCVGEKRGRWDELEVEASLWEADDCLAELAGTTTDIVDRVVPNELIADDPLALGVSDDGQCVFRLL